VTARKFLLLLAVLAAAPAAATNVSVVGLFPGKALVVIDGGAPRTLSVGQTTPEGVKLVGVTGDAAEFEIGGRRQRLALGHGRFSSAPDAPEASTTLYADAQGHFVADGTINGTAVRFLIDTGATAIAINSREAQHIGLDFRRGSRALMSTANGVAPVYRVKLDTVKLGTITLYNVDAVVHEGEHPPIVLMGMSALNQLDMQREGAQMTLKRRY
jgi:aspartyl protease family protein